MKRPLTSKHLKGTERGGVHAEHPNWGYRVVGRKKTCTGMMIRPSEDRPGIWETVPGTEHFGMVNVARRVSSLTKRRRKRVVGEMMARRAHKGKVWIGNRGYWDGGFAR